MLLEKKSCVIIYNVGFLTRSFLSMEKRGERNRYNKPLKKIIIIKGCKFGNFNVVGHISLAISPSRMRGTFLNHPQVNVEKSLM